MRHSVFVFIVVLCACGPDTPHEQRLRELIDQMEHQAESGNIGDFMDQVADDFSGEEGAISKVELKKLLRVQILKNTRVNALISGYEYELFENRAKVSMNALLTGGTRGWLPERGELFKINSAWRLSDDNWELISASWEPIIGQ